MIDRIVKARNTRNPILAEKTPRTHYQTKKWKYDVPKGEEPKSRWKEPEKEDSIVASFGSVKHKVALEKEREEAYLERIRKFEESQKYAAMASSRGGESSRFIEGTARTGTGRMDTSRFETVRSGTTTSREETERSARPATQREVPLSSIPLAAMRSLQTDHPEILRKMRAERAATYVNSLKNPLQPPDKASMSSRGEFRPGGSLKHSEAVLQRGKHKTSSGDVRPSPTIVVTARDVDTARMKESLSSLVTALEDTNQEIARQNLKIALSKKVKTFDKKSSKK